MSHKEIFFIFIMIFHSAIMLVDEFYFHIKRGLSKWERIGHPVDTFSVLLCFLCVFFLDYNSVNQVLYISFSVLSCLLIIKDEGVHLKTCTAQEQRLHALLFILHPIFLSIIYHSWISFQNKAELSNFYHATPFKLFIIFMFFSGVIFFFHQVFYWNYFTKGKPSHDFTASKQ